MARLQISDGVLEMRLVPLCHTVEHRGRVTAEHERSDFKVLLQPFDNISLIAR